MPRWVNTDGCQFSYYCSPCTIGSHESFSAVPNAVLAYVPSSDAFALTGDFNLFVGNFGVAELAVSYKLLMDPQCTNPSFRLLRSSISRLVEFYSL